MSKNENKVLPKTAPCFFCQRRFPKELLTREHVFGKWLIDRGNLANAKLTFPNGTSTKYGKLCVPACVKCNNVFGSQFENNIKNILDTFNAYRHELITNDVSIDMMYGFDDSAKTRITLWLQKIYFGILYFEAHLLNVPPKTIQPAKKAVKSSTTFQHTCRSIIEGVGFNLAATLLVFDLPDNDLGAFDYFDSYDPPAVALKIDNKMFFVAISDGQLTNNYLSGGGLESLRADILANRFGTVSHIMAFAYPLATMKNLPVSPKFIYSHNQITNMSNTGLGQPPIINSKHVMEDAFVIYRQICDSRKIPSKEGT